ncbi:hypothetical protein C8Q70DRAFT_1007050 [Cubamyces menziesii]|nr:hypothetical protein C8Q70DRAFT_1007050 [Cubamyces menziesii]
MQWRVATPQAAHGAPAGRASRDASQLSDSVVDHKRQGFTSVGEWNDTVRSGDSRRCDGQDLSSCVRRVAQGMQRLRRKGARHSLQRG